MNIRTQKIEKFINKNRYYSVKEAINILIKKYKNISAANFDETVEIIYKLKSRKRKENFNINSFIYLPNSINKNNKIAAIVNSNLHESVKKAGADIIGTDNLIKKILAKKIDFDYCVTTPDLTKKVIKIAKILGPKGIMPNIDNGTISKDIVETIKKIKQGVVKYRNNGSTINIGVAKLSFSFKQIMDNITISRKLIEKTKSQKIHKIIINEACITTTHGPSIKLDLSNFF